MAKDVLAIHIDPDANPQNCLATVNLLAQSPDLSFEKADNLVDYVRDAGVKANGKVHTLLSNMQVVKKIPNIGIKLTSLGLTLARFRDDVQSDLLHFLIYTGWDEKSPMEFLYSWAYRYCCQKYWQVGHLVVDTEYKRTLVADMVGIAPLTFAQQGDFLDVSFGPKSIDGLHDWLGGLTPPVIEVNSKATVFSRRSFCPPELLLMALQWVLRDEQDIVGIDILLTREKREAICQVCLLEPDALDRALDWMLPIFPNVISPGTSAGFYGRFVRFHKVPTFEDIVR